MQLGTVAGIPGSYPNISEAGCYRARSSQPWRCASAGLLSRLPSCREHAALRKLCIAATSAHREPCCVRGELLLPRLLTWIRLWAGSTPSSRPSSC